ncbi:MAG TPA: hypothetical protein VF534_08965 [Paraburkholderia sp.]
MNSSPDAWNLEWAHGRFDVFSVGGMLGNVILRLGSQDLKPFYDAPWLSEPAAEAPGVLANLRSEFPCAPFGLPWPAESVEEAWKQCLTEQSIDGDETLDATDDLLHGYASTASWTLVQKTELEIEIAIDYPPTSSISRLVRVIRADPECPAIDLSLQIEARRKCRRPIGLHPNLKLPMIERTFRIEPGKFRFGMVHPGGPEPGISKAQPGALFDRLNWVPMCDERTDTFDLLPFAHDTEEILQLCGTDGTVVLTDENADISYKLSWDSAVLPSLLLWVSNRGRSAAPWNNRNLCVGVEPIASAFELGSRASLAANPINQRGEPTAVAVEPGNPVKIAYRFEVLKP